MFSPYLHHKLANFFAQSSVDFFRLNIIPSRPSTSSWAEDAEAEVDVVAVKLHWSHQITLQGDDGHDNNCSRSCEYKTNITKGETKKNICF